MSFSPNQINGRPEEMGMQEIKQLGTQLAAEAGGKAAEVKNKVQDVSQKVQRGEQIAGAAQSALQGLRQQPAGTGAAGTAPINGNAATAKDTTSSQAGAALLPVWTGCEVRVNEIEITPFASLSVSQVHGGHHSLVLHFSHEVVQPEGTFIIDQAGDLLGKKATIVLKNLNNPDGSRMECKFIVSSIELDQQNADEGMLKLTAYSPTWLLDGAPHFESFTGKNLTDIANAVTEPLGQIDSRLKASATFESDIPFVCRYNESAWNFLKRLASQTGQWLYCNGSDLIFGKPEAEDPVQLVYGKDCYHIKFNMRALPLQNDLSDYNAAQDSTISEKANKYDGDSAFTKTAFDASQAMFKAPSNSLPATLGTDKTVVEAMAKANAGGRASLMYIMSGESTLYELKVGMLVEVSFRRMGKTTSHGQMRIIKVHHHLNASSEYTNTFEAIPAGAGAPLISYKHPNTNPILATVIDNADSQGRIKVEFIGWKGGGKKTNWIRHVTPDAGGGGDKVAKNRGLVTVPEIGDQVFVDWEGGNPDKPFVTGSVFHGKHGSGGGPNNHIKSLSTRSGNTVSLDDAAGSILVADAKKNSMLMDGAGNITVSSSATTSIKVGGTKEAGPDSGMVLKAGGEIEITAISKLSLFVGSSSLVMDKDGIIKINGVNITLSGENNVITGSTDTKIDGGTVHITPSGVTTIKGSEVDIN